MAGSTDEVTSAATHTSDSPIQDLNLIKPKSHVISIPLNEDNCMLWKYQVETALKGYGLQEYVKGTMTIPPIMIKNKEGVAVSNQEFIRYQQQDSLLASWLISSISANLLSQIIGKETSYEIWTAIEQIFNSQSAARIMHYRRQLQNLKKDNQTMSEYLTMVKTLCDKLSATGHKISESEHVLYITSGLDEEYESVVTFIASQRSIPDLQYVHSTLLAHEGRIEQRRLDQSEISVNFIAARNKNQFKNKNTQSNRQEVQFQRYGNQNIRGRGRGGRWNSNNRVKCQICEKFGHIASKCYFRFNSEFNTAQQGQPKMANLAQINQAKSGEISRSQIQGSNSDDTSKSDEISMEDWYPDSGATNHVTSSLQNLNLGNKSYTEKEIKTTKRIISTKAFEIPPPELAGMHEIKTQVVNTNMESDSTSMTSTKSGYSSMELENEDYQHRDNDADLHSPERQDSHGQSTSEDETDQNTHQNKHHMVTRAKSGIFKPKIYMAALDEREPLNYKEAVSNSKWKGAMNEEFSALQSNKTWSLVKPPNHKNIIGCKWTYKLKKDSNGDISKYKARLVTKGYTQQYGFDFSETFSPVVKPTTIRIILTIALHKQWGIKQLDVHNAFLNGELHEDIYMAQPEGYIKKGEEELVCKLHKALYGLKQASRMWYEKLKVTLSKMEFITSKADSSLYIRRNNNSVIYILVYVDDILVTGNNKQEIIKVTEHLNQAFSIKDLGDINHFLGIQVTHRPNKVMFLSQKQYAMEILNRAKMDKAKPLPTPMISNHKLSKHNGEGFEDEKLYRSIVGALQYLTITRPELCYSVNKVSQFMQCPAEKHWIAVKRILRYVRGTLNHGLYLKNSKELNINSYSDADWASDPDDRRSTSGYCIFLGDNPISWSSKKQATISRSSTEAEYRALAATTAEIIWIQSLLNELGIASNKKATIWCDNLSAIALSANPVQHARTKHMEIDIYFVREFVEREKIQVCHVPSFYQKADVLTKAISTKNFGRMREGLRVFDGGAREEEEDRKP